jgi:CheY-like chemotaxis protein
VDLASIALSAIDVVTPTAAAKGITIVTQITTNQPWLMGDADRLQQIVWNLLSNAIKFTETGGRVTVGISHTESGVALKVEDTGRGIAPDFLPQIFERFRQADSSSSRRHGGLGLGLSLVRTLTELHGGTIAATSTPGVGSTFIVTFPGRTELTDGGAAAAEAAAARDLQGLRVLVVEDDGDAREILTAMLRGHGIEVSEAASAAEALAAIDADVAAGALPDAILSDVGLPGQDAYSMIETLAARPASRGGEIPLIAITAYGQPQDKRRALASGFRLHLTKPVEPRTLMAALASIID